MAPPSDSCARSDGQRRDVRRRSVPSGSAERGFDVCADDLIVREHVREGARRPDRQRKTVPPHADVTQPEMKLPLQRDDEPTPPEALPAVDPRHELRDGRSRLIGALRTSRSTRSCSVIATLEVTLTRR